MPGHVPGGGQIAMTNSNKAPVIMKLTVWWVGRWEVNDYLNKYLINQRAYPEGNHRIL